MKNERKGKMIFDEVSKTEKSPQVYSCEVAMIHSVKKHNKSKKWCWVHCNCRWQLCGILFQRFKGYMDHKMSPESRSLQRGLKLDCVHMPAGHRFHRVCTEQNGIPVIRLLPGCHSREHKRLSVQVSCEFQLGGGSAGAEVSPRPGAQKSCHCASLREFSDFGEGSPDWHNFPKAPVNQLTLLPSEVPDKARPMSCRGKHKVAANV